MASRGRPTHPTQPPCGAHLSWLAWHKSGGLGASRRNPVPPFSALPEAQTFGQTLLAVSGEDVSEED